MIQRFERQRIVAHCGATSLRNERRGGRKDDEACATPHPEHAERLAAKCREVAALLGPDLGRQMHIARGAKNGRKGDPVRVRGDGIDRLFPRFKDAAAFFGCAECRVSRAVAYGRSIAGCRLEKERVA